MDGQKRSGSRTRKSRVPSGLNGSSTEVYGKDNKEGNEEPRGPFYERTHRGSEGKNRPVVPDVREGKKLLTSQLQSTSVSGTVALKVCLQPIRDPYEDTSDSW